MKYHTLFFPKISKDVAKFISAAVVTGALRVSSFLSLVNKVDSLQLLMLGNYVPSFVKVFFLRGRGCILLWACLFVGPSVCLFVHPFKKLKLGF